MKYRVQTLVFNDDDQETQIEGRVVGVIGSGNIEYEVEGVEGKQAGLGVSCLVEFPDSPLTVAQMVVQR